uniref:Translation initiation factor IF-2, mitochondrial (inferred by orthology to a human protein) n=1 Tax=Strongyloides venezuelensis TaxID=75913 RepID=A0A0K0G3T5_STRVS
MIFSCFNKLIICSSKRLAGQFYVNRTIHNSYVSLAGWKSKFRDPVRLRTKSKKLSVDFYGDSSLLEFSKAAGLNFDEVSKAILKIDEKYKKYTTKKNKEKPLDKEILVNLASCFDIKPQFFSRPLKEKKEVDEDVYPQPLPDDKDCEKRAPIVTIMGHVDHGKTTLLDALRSSRIVDTEHGGITQHIGAFSVKLKNSDSKITFLDTPGHAAFKKMRQRGAQSTDIVVLVVAADDGVKEQTVESIKYAREAGVQMIIAINKCDKPTANPNFTRRSLMEHDIVVEDMGGDIQVVEISALYKKNIDELQEALVALADIMNLKSTRKGLAEGSVIESSSIHGLGKVCTIIVQRGTLKKGSVIVCGTSWCKVRTMTDEFGKTIKEAGPVTPVRISGWRSDSLPSPGDIILEVEDEGKAQKVVNFREKKKMDLFTEEEYKNIEVKQAQEREIYRKNREFLLNRGQKYGSTLRYVVHKEQRFSKKTDDELKLNLIIRSDVDGTLEAILNVIDTYNSDKVGLNLVNFSVGPPTDKDIELATETNSLIYCFNTPISAGIKEMALKSNVKIEQFLVIYRLIEALKNELNGKLPPIEEMIQVAEGHVLKEFIITDNGQKQPIAGSLVDWGVFKKNNIFKIWRGSKLIYEGNVETFKCGNDFVNEVKTNREVGISIANKDIRFKTDDMIEVYDVVSTPQKIDWDPPGF